MNQDAIGVATGLAVLVIGVVAVVVMVRPVDEPPAEGPAAEVSAVARSEPGVAGPAEVLPGVGAAVTGVLQWSGDVRVAGEDDLAQLPPSVAALLVDAGVPLRVPVDAGQRQ